MVNFNFVDLIVIVVLAFFIWQGFQTGFIGGLLNLLTTIVSFLLASLLYPFLGSFFSHQLGVSENLALILAFFVILIFSEGLLTFVSNFAYKHLVSPLHKASRTFIKIDQILGIFPALLVGAILISLFLLIPLLLPFNQATRVAVQNSWWGENVLTRLISYEPRIEKYLNRLPYQNLVYLLTPNPESEKSIRLSIPENAHFSVDKSSEQTMFDLVNKERQTRGLSTLKPDDELTQVGRAHCLDMFQRSYFSHYTPEGKSPFDRMKEAAITYTLAGENLAYAPSVQIAHQGLMNSPGHRENILRSGFGHLGVGVIDGGFSGKMFCQEFTD